MAPLRWLVERDPARSAAFIAKLRAAGLPAEAADAEAAVRAADIIVTATTATAPLFSARWVQPGTHISSMGSDSVGKQELPPELFTQARLFCDLPEQSTRVGEFQHAQPDAPLTAIGDLLLAKSAGRQIDAEITVFDSSGISLQDLYVGKAILATVLSVRFEPVSVRP